MSSNARSTIVKPPPDDPSKAPIENILEITELGVLGPDIFTNTRQPWHPKGARGIFGGVVIAQCLAAAHKTLAPSQDLAVHSLHCYFLLAGSADVPILFHVERVRDGRSFATRTVQARQRGRCIFTATISFARRSPDGFPTVRHAAPLPSDVGPPPSDRIPGPDEEPVAFRGGPYQVSPLPLKGAEDRPGASAHEAKKASPHHERRSRHWVRARGRISDGGGDEAHAQALAYMSDSFFIGTVSRVQHLWRWGVGPHELDKLSEETRRAIGETHDFESGAVRISDGDIKSGGGGDGASVGDGDGAEDRPAKFSPAAWRDRPHVGMMVSLDHSIYFHDPRGMRVDDWLLTEMESVWAGDGRALVSQRIWSRDGRLLATCVQEGVIRLKPDEKSASPKL